MAQQVIPAQVLTISSSEESTLDSMFSSYTVFTLNIDSLNNYVRRGNMISSFSLEIENNSTWTFELKQIPSSEGCEVVRHTAQGQIIEPCPESNQYSGHLQSEPMKSARFYIYEDRLLARFSQGNVKYKIMNLSRILTNTNNEDEFILVVDDGCLYNSASGNGCDCTTEIINEDWEVIHFLDVAIDIDYEFYQKYKGSDPEMYTERAISEARYYISFTDFSLGEYFNFLMKEVHVNIWEVADPYPNNNALFDAFTDYWHDFKRCVDRDIVHLFTAKPGYGPDGEAPPGGACSPNGFSISNHKNTQREKSTAHEISHLVGAQHTNNHETCGCLCDNDPLVDNPIMCTFQLGYGHAEVYDFPDVCYSEFSQEKIWNFIANHTECLLETENNTVPNECERCYITTNITSNDDSPIVGCDPTTFTIEVCNDCVAKDLDLLYKYSLGDLNIIEDANFDESFILAESDPPIVHHPLTVSFDALECKTYTIIANALEGGVITAKANYTNASGDLITASDVISFDPVNPNDFVELTGSLSSILNDPNIDIPSAPLSCDTEGLFWRVSGTLYIDIPGPGGYCLKNSLILMEEGAEIIIEEGSFLRMEDSEIRGCTHMWKGMTIEANATLTLRNNTIKDAQYAVSLEHQANAIITHNNFVDNYVGIYTAPNPTLQSIYIGYEYGNQYIGKNGMLDAFSGQSPAPLALPYAGIVLNKTYNTVESGINLEYPNIFKNMNNGIIANHSILYIFGGEFENIQNDGNVYPGGVAVYSLGGKLVQWQTKINDANVGTFLNSSSAEVLGNQYSNVTTGNSIHFCKNKEVIVEYNTIKSTSAGIYTYWNTPLLNGRISSNIIEDVNDSSSSAYGIRANENSNSETGWKINYNDIDLNNSRYGISLTGGSGSSIENNNITVNQNNPDNYTAIRIQGGNNIDIKCNNIEGKGATDPQNILGKGIYNQGSSLSTISCNVINNTPIGINLWGMAEQSTLEGNDLLDHVYGLLLGLYDTDGTTEGNAFIGAQEHNGNLWSGLSVNWGAQHLGNQDVVEFSRFDVDEDENSLFVTSVDANATWFFVEDLPNEDSYTCSSYTNCINGNGGGPSGPVVIHTEKALNKKLLKGTLQTEGFDEELRWTGRRHLYQQLNRNLAQVQSGTLLDSFLIEVSNTTIDSFHNIHQDMLNALAIDSLDQFNLLEYPIKINGFMTDLITIDSSLAIETDDSIRLLLVQEKQILLSKIETDATVYFDLNEQLENQYLTAITNVETNNNTINTSFTYETDTKEVNNMKLQSVMANNTNLTNTQITELEKIANQCPLLGGDAVYEARSILAYYMDKEYNDVLLCREASGRNAKKSDEESSDRSKGFKVFPNPTDKHIMLVYPTDLKENLDVEIRSLLGQSILKSNLDKDNGRQQISLSTVPTGIYLLIIKNKEQTFLTEKIVIVR